MSLGPARSSSQCLRQEVRPSEFTVRTNSATADQDWPSQISGAATCLRPLAATHLALDKGAGVSWEFHPHTQKAESEYFMLSLKMVTRPSPSLLRENLFGRPLGRCKVDTGIFRHWFSVVVTLGIARERKEILKPEPQPKIPISLPWGLAWVRGCFKAPQ